MFPGSGLRLRSPAMPKFVPSRRWITWLSPQRAWAIMAAGILPQIHAMESERWNTNPGSLHLQRLIAELSWVLFPSLYRWHRHPATSWCQNGQTQTITTLIDIQGTASANHRVSYNSFNGSDTGLPFVIQGAQGSLRFVGPNTQILLNDSTAYSGAFGGRIGDDAVQLTSAIFSYANSFSPSRNLRQLARCRVKLFDYELCALGRLKRARLNDNPCRKS